MTSFKGTWKQQCQNPLRGNKHTYRRNAFHLLFEDIAVLYAYFVHLYDCCWQNEVGFGFVSLFKVVDRLVELLWILSYWQH